MQALCNDAYKMRSVIEHVVIDNNLDWKKFLEPLVLKKEGFKSGMLLVSAT
jgi:hypothetical protein